MATNINGTDCAVELLGTGLPECILRFGQPIGVIKTPVNWSLTLATETFDSLAYIREQQQKGNFYPFLNRFNYIDNTGDNTFQESSTGDESFVRSAKPKMRFEYDLGYEFSRILHSHRAKMCGILLVFDNNVIATHTSQDGTKLKPIIANHFTPTTFKFNDGSNSSMVGVDIQLRNADAFNAEMAVIKLETFDIDEIKGVLDTDIVVTTAPTATDTELKIKVTPKANTKLSIGVLDASSLKVVGNTITAVVYSADDEEYTITVQTGFTLGETYRVKINDGTYDSALVEDQIYAGKGELLTVA